MIKVFGLLIMLVGLYLDFMRDVKAGKIVVIAGAIVYFGVTVKVLYDRYKANRSDAKKD